MNGAYLIPEYAIPRRTGAEDRPCSGQLAVVSFKGVAVSVEKSGDSINIFLGDVSAPETLAAVTAHLTLKKIRRVGQVKSLVSFP
jgi:hypothetical protein